MNTTDRDPDTLNRPEGNDLDTNYGLHDIGQAHVSRHLEHLGLDVEQWGIDMRNHDESLIYDEKMDLKVRDPDQQYDLAALLEIKTKRNEGWFGVINRRHFRHYLHHAQTHDVPTTIYMSLVDEDRQRITRDAFVPIEPWKEYQSVLDGDHGTYDVDAHEEFLSDNVDEHTQIERTWRAPDGNQVVLLDLDTSVAWPTFSGWVAHGSTIV